MLCNPVVLVGMGIEIAFSMSKAFAVPVGVLQMVRDLPFLLHLHIGKSIKEA